MGGAENLAAGWWRAGLPTSSRAQLLIATVIALLSWPTESVLPGVGLDASWKFGEHDLPSLYYHGHPLTNFTYGPLGFLAVPAAWYRATFVLALIVATLIHLALALVVVRSVARVLPGVPAAIPCLLALIVLRLAGFEFELFPVVAVFVVVELADRQARGEPIRPRLALVLGIGCSAIAALVKFSVGISFGAVLILAVFALADGTLRRRTAIAATAVAGVLAVNVTLFSAVTRQPATYGRFLRDSLDIASGYQAMSVSDRPGLDGRLDVLLVGVSALACLIGAFTQPATRKRLPVALMVLLVAYFTYREALQRHDAPHILITLGAVVALPLVLPSARRWGQGCVLLTLIAFAVAGFANVGVQSRLVDFDGSRVNLLDTVRATFSTGVTREAQARVRSAATVPADALAQLRGHRVQVVPWDADITYGYGLDWDPVDVYQLYSAYTPRLDREDAADLLSPAGPDRVLAAIPAPAIDARFTFGEAPAFQRALFCDFRPLVVEGDWEVLGRTHNQCGPSTPLSTAVVRPGETLDIPPAPAASIVTATITLDLPPSQKLLAVVAKPANSELRLGDTEYRMVTATAPDGIIIGAAPGLFPAAVAGSLTATTLRYTGPATAVHVVFSAIPFEDRPPFTDAPSG